MSTAAGARDMTESVPAIHTPAMNTPRAACATFNQFTLLAMLGAYRHRLLTTPNFNDWYYTTFVLYTQGAGRKFVLHTSPTSPAGSGSGAGAWWVAINTQEGV